MSLVEPDASIWIICIYVHFINSTNIYIYCYSVPNTDSRKSLIEKVTLKSKWLLLYEGFTKYLLYDKYHVVYTAFNCPNNNM